MILCTQALLDEEKSMSAKNQLLKKEAEKLAGDLKAAQDGGKSWSTNHTKTFC